MTNKYLGILGTFGALHVDTVGAVTKQTTDEFVYHHRSQLSYVNTLITHKKVLVASVVFGLRLFPFFFYFNRLFLQTSPFIHECCMLPKLSNNPYPTAFPYGNGMVLHFYQQQESSTTKTVHKVINKGLKTYV